MLFVFISGVAFTCENTPSTLGSVYKCLLADHPSLKYLEFRQAENEGRNQAASRIPNPEVEIKSTVSGDKELEVELRQPVEIGGRRAARREHAQAENSLALASDTLKTGQIALSIAESLIRLRQLEKNLFVISEAKSTTSSIAKRLQAKSSLTPEDRSTLGLIRLYESTLTQKTRLLEAERDSLKLLIETTSAVQLAGIDWNSEQRRKEWPTLSQIKENTPVEVRSAQADLALAQAQSNQATAEAWPSLSIGPSFKRQYENNENNWGLMVNMTLPLWDLNKGERAATRARAQQSETLLVATRKLETSRLKSLQSTYEKAILALQSAPQTSSIKSLISSNERQLSRGLIQPNALIETYRSVLESLEVTNETELQALRAFFQYETSLGNIPKELL